jgi:kynureninase
MPTDRAACEALDAADPLAFARERFVLPEGVIYLDGNSLGALPRAAAARMAETVQGEWGQGLIRSWNDAGWIDLPARIAARIAPLVGAAEGQLTVADSTSVNLFKLAAAAVRMNAPRKVVVAEAGDFPTDLYVLQGLADLLGLELRFVERGPWRPP